MSRSGHAADPRIAWPAAHSPDAAVLFAQNAIEVRATPKAVWSLLVDCVAWPGWYKHCSDVSILRGGPTLGPDSQFRFKTLNLFFEPVIEVFEPYRELTWTAKGPLGTSGAHAWYIEERPGGGCRVITEEAQKGFILTLVRGRTRRNLLSAHGDWLQSLKSLAEEPGGRSSSSDG